MEPLDFYQCQFRPKDILMPLLEPSLGCTPFLGHFHANLSPTLLCLRSHFWSVMTLPVFSGSLLTSFHIGIPPHQILACLISSWSLLFGGLVPTHLSSCLVYPGNYANHNLQRVFSGPNLGELIDHIPIPKSIFGKEDRISHIPLSLTLELWSIGKKGGYLDKLRFC